MRKGFTAFSANKDIDLAPRAKVLAADSLMKWRRLVLFTVGDYQRRFIVSSKMNRLTRRKATKLIGARSGALLLPMGASHLFSATELLSMLTRVIPSSGNRLTVVDVVAWYVFDVVLMPHIE